jgi:SDR family mycofactocin-dependent oxidoreductase
MGRVDGKVALVTGAARGQGRAYSLRLAEEGAAIVAFDLCESVPGVLYEGATEEDLAETVALVESIGGEIIARKGDVRSPGDVEAVVAEGLDRFGYIDVLVSNAGVSFLARSWEISEDDWATQIEVNLTGSWRVAKAVLPSMIEAGRGGSIIFITSGTAHRASGNMAHYASTKSGLEGLCREMALEVAPYRIRVNTLQPTAVRTPMMDNQGLWELFTPGQDDRSLEERRQGMLDLMSQFNILEVPWVQPEDLANGVLFLASDESSMVTGSPLRVDAGYASH